MIKMLGDTFRHLYLYILIAVLKLLLIPSYFSTDFEVHRNWLAITHSLPISKWYFDESSHNATLDYPPFFAWFEYLLSQLACNNMIGRASSLFDSKMCELSSVGYASEKTILFQRLSVILFSDLIYYLALVRFFSHYLVDRKKLNSIQFWSLVGIAYGLPALIMVDSMCDDIHFQYNAILFGIFVYSICFVQEGKLLQCGITFAILLNFKHIFLYMAPAYFLFLLVHYCFTYTTSLLSFSIGRFVKLGVAVLVVFGLSFGPFFASGGIVQIKQIFARMFPFERGLTHAYWAPNFWAIYNTADKIALMGAKVMNKANSVSSGASLTGGLVGLDQGTHMYLPTISPLVTIILTMGTSFLLCFIQVLKDRNECANKGTTALKKNLLICVVHSTFAFFFFGWHVHEKAILMVLLPVVLLTVSKDHRHGFIIDGDWLKIFVSLNIVGTYSLFPLLFRPFETPIKWILLVCHLACTMYADQVIWNREISSQKAGVSFNMLEKLYLYGFIIIELYSVFIHGILLPQLPFLPLMIISVYSAFGVAYSWIQVLRLTIFGQRKEKVQ